MRTLAIDIETYSDYDLAKCGVYKYAQSPVFEVLLFAYSLDNSSVKIVDFTSGENLPSDVLHALLDKNVIKTAFNANFERVCLSAHLGIQLPPDQWQCTMVQSAFLGLPLSLEGVGAVLSLNEQKMSEGKNLIRYFSKPCVPTKVNGGRTRNLPHHAPDKWQLFKDYCIRDVQVEMAIREKLAKFPIPDDIQKEYVLDQIINDRGIAVDIDFVERAIECDGILKEKLRAEMQELTKLQNPNSVIQMKAWLSENGLDMESIGKKEVAEQLKTAPSPLKEVLELRQQSAKSSIKKYSAIETAICTDGRLRGMFQFYGANRTGRFAGRIVQLQNLPQNHIDDLDEVRTNIKGEDYTGITPDDLSELIRTAFIPSAGKKFIVADFSAIEARVLSWLAKESWRNDVFATHGKIYEASASEMFGVPIEEITKTNPLRQKGKIAELALGYGGSVGALKAMGALEMGLQESELQPLVNAWRWTNRKIVKLWYAVEDAIITALSEHRTTEVNGIKFQREKGMLFITLPSGRRLSYVKPRLSENRFGGTAITYEGVGANKKWERIESYGAKFVENIVQAISRDILCFAMNNLCFYDIVGHVHDEIIIEADSHTSVEGICDIMSETPSWAKGLLLRADGFETKFYRKD